MLFNVVLHLHVHVLLIALFYILCHYGYLQLFNVMNTNTLLMTVNCSYCMSRTQCHRKFSQHLYNNFVKYAHICGIIFCHSQKLSFIKTFYIMFYGAAQRSAARREQFCLMYVCLPYLP